MTKRILFFLAFVFLSSVFFVDNSQAQSTDCTRAGGVCTGGNSCVPPKVSAKDGSSECTKYMGTACCKDPDDNCSGSCKNNCSTFEEPTTDPGEYCGTAGQTCCKPKSLALKCSDTPGNSCKGDMCATLSGLESAPGSCPSGEYCCKNKSAGGGSGSGSGSGSRNSGGGMWNVESLAGFGLPDGTVSGIVENLVSTVLYLFGFLGIIAFVISGIFYLTAAGDADQEKKAKLAMKMGIFGIVVGLVGLVIIQAVDLLLRAGGSGV